jgi:hypothetical protein
MLDRAGETLTAAPAFSNCASAPTGGCVDLRALDGSGLTDRRVSMALDTLAPRPRWSVAPLFIVEDVVATANYYRDKLGANVSASGSRAERRCSSNRGRCWSR